MIDLALASVVITAITLNIYIVDLIKKKRREIKQHDESLKLTSYDADPLDDEPSNVASTVLGVLGGIGGGIAGAVTGGVPGAVAGAGLGSTAGQTAGNLMEGNEVDMMQ